MINHIYSLITNAV